MGFNKYGSQTDLSFSSLQGAYAGFKRLLRGAALAAGIIPTATPSAPAAAAAPVRRAPQYSLRRHAWQPPQQKRHQRQCLRSPLRWKAWKLLQME